MRWKPEELVTELQQRKLPGGKFYFTQKEFLKEGQIRSFFSRLKALRGKPQQNMEVDDGDDEPFEDDQTFMEVSRRYKLRDAAGVSKPATTIVPHNRPTSPDKRHGSTPDVTPPNKRRQSEMNSKKEER
ncbi:unnamed protein product, partial [Didymodactylos carnosus]